jgi:hypothetical protein
VAIYFLSAERARLATAVHLLASRHLAPAHKPRRLPAPLAKYAALDPHHTAKYAALDPHHTAKYAALDPHHTAKFAALDPHHTRQGHRSPPPRRPISKCSPRYS